jgi:hypothetical protein
MFNSVKNFDPYYNFMKFYDNFCQIIHAIKIISILTISVNLSW